MSRPRRGVAAAARAAGRGRGEAWQRRVAAAKGGARSSAPYRIFERKAFVRS